MDASFEVNMMNGRIPVEEHEFETIALLLVPFQNDHTAQIINMDTMGKLKKTKEKMRVKKSKNIVLKHSKHFVLKNSKNFVLKNSKNLVLEILFGWFLTEKTFFGTQIFLTPNFWNFLTIFLKILIFCYL